MHLLLRPHRGQHRERAHKFPPPPALPLLRTSQMLPSFLMRSTAASGKVLWAEPQFATCKPTALHAQELTEQARQGGRLRGSTSWAWKLMERITKSLLPQDLNGLRRVSGLSLRDPHPPQANFTAPRPPPSKPRNRMLRPSTLRPPLSHRPAQPRLGSPSGLHQRIRGFRSSWKDQDRTRGGWAAERRGGAPHVKDWVSGAPQDPPSSALQARNRGSWAGRPGTGSSGRDGGGARRGARQWNSSPTRPGSSPSSPELAAARGPPCGPLSPLPTHLRGWAKGEPGGGVLQGPLSLSSGIRRGHTLHPASGAGGQNRRGRSAPQAAPPSRLAESSSPFSRGSLRSGGGLREPPAPRKEGGGPGPGPPGRCRVGGGGGGGDSAALRPPPRNFAAAGAAVATGTESFCSPMSGLPGQEGGCHSQVGPRPGHTAYRTSSQSQGSSDSWGPQVRWPPNSDLEC